MNYNLYFQNSFRSDLLGYNMSTVCTERQSNTSNTSWRMPEIGMQGVLCIGHETGVKDVLRLEISENDIPLNFESKRNRWTPKWCETYYRSTPMETYYKKSGCYVVREKKCITDDDVFVSELCITNNKKETATLQIKMITPLEKEESIYKIHTPIIPKALRQKYFLDGWFALCGMEAEQKIEIPAGKSVLYKYCFGFSRQSEGDAKEKVIKEFSNNNSFFDNEDKLNQWFNKMVPTILTDNKDLEKIYYYRYLLIYINTFTPKKVIPEHWISGECMYENRYGAWYGCPVGLPLALQVNEAMWLKNSNLSKNQLNMWMENTTVLKWYIQYTPYAAYRFYQHHENKQWLETIYDNLKEYTLKNYKDDVLLPVTEGSWGTGAEYQPAFYQWTNPKWDWRHDKEGKALGYPIQKIYRLDEISFFGANLKACAEIAKELGKERDYLYFEHLKEEVVEAIKTKFWNEVDKIFYDIDAATMQQCNEAACYDSFAPFLFYLIEEKPYTECFEKLFDDTWFSDEFSVTTVAKNCPMYWFDNCIVGPTAAGLKEVHEYECCWNGPIWPFATSLVLNAFGTVAEKDSHYRKQWVALFDKYTEVHFLNGDRSLPVIFEHYRPGDGTTFSKACDYFHSAWIDLFMHYWAGISIENDEITGIYAAHMRDVQLDVVCIATVASIQSLALVACKFLTGAIYDKFGLRLTILICDVAAFVAMLSLAVISNTSSGRVFAIVYAIASSAALPLDTIMLPILANDLFGQKAYTKILGLFVSICTAGYACSYPLFNWGFDVCGSYKPMLLAGGGITLAVTVVFQFVITVSERQQKTYWVL